ncbi:iron ABC transporter ATP-binding protein [Synergistales bacterium]|nr:iron ABC transporter ATP-binding protein [Synergistales bacterium]
MSVSITIDGVEKKFSDFQALNDVNLRCPAGTFTAILGPSGCGKTTLLRLLAGFDKPTAGEIRFDDEIVSSPRYSLPTESRDLGMVFQSFALWPHMTVIEHVLFTFKHRGVTKDKAEALKILRSLELETQAEKRPAQLSGGQRQRVALARAIAGNPGTLLMDEPLSSLDAELRVGMRREISGLHRSRGSTVVYVTHDQEEAMAMADRVVVMNKGQIKQIGAPKDVYATPRSRFVARFVSKANLARGQWDGNRFFPEGASGVCWSGELLKDAWTSRGCYPVRPEQLTLSRDGNGIAAEVESVQYQGREIHVLFRVSQGFWKSYMPSDVRLDHGQKVILNLASSANSTT